jgi:dihydroorotate dehydrogenase (fumarate)
VSADGGVDLTTNYLGLDLTGPLMASSSPLTGEVESLLALQEAGAAAVVLPSIFEEEIEHDAVALDLGRDFGAAQHGEAAEGYLPEPAGPEAGPDHFLQGIRAARAALRIPIIASLNGTSTGGWTRYANRLEDEGADALELNIYLIAADPTTTGVEIEDRYLRLVSAVRDAVDVPLAVKVGPQFSAPANMARRLVEAGADGLVLFNRFYQPDIDLDEMTTTTDLVLSAPAEMRLTLRWIAILAGRLDASLAATTGVHDAEAVIKLILAGADVAMMASALIRNGPDHLATALAGVRQWLGDRGYESVDQARGSLSQASSPDPSAFERANYMQTLQSYGRPH